MDNILVTTCCGLPIDECPGCHENMMLVSRKDYMTPENISKAIGIDWSKVDFTIDQFEIGLNMEMKEHHDDPETKVIDTKEEAARVAWAHLKEDPKYYEKLIKMEADRENVLENILCKINENTITKEDFNYLLSEATPSAVIDRVRRKMNPLRDRIKKRSSKDIKLAARVQPSRKRSNNTQMQHNGKQGHRHSVRTQKRQNKYEEAVDFINVHIGKPIKESDIPLNNNFLSKVANKLMTHENANRDWLFDLINRLDKDV